MSCSWNIIDVTLQSTEWKCIWSHGLLNCTFKHKLLRSLCVRIKLCFVICIFFFMSAQSLTDFWKRALRFCFPVTISLTHTNQLYSNGASHGNKGKPWGRGVFPMMPYHKRPLEEVGDKHMTCRQRTAHSWSSGNTLNHKHSQSLSDRQRLPMTNTGLRC